MPSITSRPCVAAGEEWCTAVRVAEREAAAVDPPPDAPPLDRVRPARAPQVGHALGGIGVVGCRSSGLHQDAGADGHRPDVESALLGSGDGRDVLGEAVQPGCVVVQHPESVRVDVTDAVLDGLQVGLDAGQRRPHLVCEVGEQPATGGLHVAQPFRQPVDGRGQRVELGPQTGTGDPGPVVAMGDLGCRGRHGLGGALDAACEECRDAQGQQDAGRQGHAEGYQERGAEGLFDVRGLRRGVRHPGLAQVVVEDPWPDGGGHQPGGPRTGQQDQGLGGEQSGRQTCGASPSLIDAGVVHRPVPMR
jgi:hypothetical protein